MKEKILKLREEGKSYNQIQKILGCSKSTISYHCSPTVKIKQRERFNKKRREKREIQRQFIRRVKSIFGCIDCQNKDWRVLDFDHVRGEKSFNLSNHASYAFTLNKLKAEMRKCEIRCANCHRIKTYEERNNV